MIYHTNTTGPSKQGFLKGFVKALELAKANGTKEVAFSVHTLANLDGVVEETLGQDFVKSFKKNHIAIYDDVHVHLETERINSSMKSGVAFALFVSTARLEEILKDYRVKDTVYVPWAPEELAKHLATHDSSIEI